MRLSFKIGMLFVLQALLILVPLTWTSTTSELFEFPKMIITYVGVILMGALWLMRMVHERRLIFKRTPFELAILLFLGSQLISTLFSINMHTSIFGYYSRFNGGLLSLISYAVIYFAAVSNFDRNDAKILLKTLLFTAIVSSLYALPEHFGHSPSCLMISGKFTANCWVQDVQFRVFGTFGQPNWLAAYLISVMYIPLAFLLKKSNRLTSTLPYWLMNILFFVVLLFTKSRSGLIGFVVGLIVFSILAFITKKQHQKNVLKTMGIYVGILALSFVIFGKNISGTTDKVLNLIHRPTQTTTQTPATIQPVNSLEVNITPSSDIRRIVWKGAWELAKQHPLVGTGVETFAYAYYGVRPIEHNLVSEWDFLYNKAHNEFLNYAATTGFIGLLTYLFFLGSYIVWSLKQRNHLTAALVSGFIALCISNFFGFSTVPVNTLLFLFPALAVILLQNRPEEEKKADHPWTPGYWIISIAAFFLLILVYRGFHADVIYAQGRAAKDARKYQEAIDKLQQAVKTVPNEALYTDELAQTASEIAVILHQSGQAPQASQAANIAIELSNRTLNLNKVHLNYYKTRAKIFLNLATINPAFAIEAGATLDAAINKAPTDAKLWFNRALLTEQLGYKNESLNIFERTIALKPNYENARYQFGQVLGNLGKFDEAKIQYQYILDHINPGNTTVQSALAKLATASAVVKSDNEL